MNDFNENICSDVFTLLDEIKKNELKVEYLKGEGVKIRYRNKEDRAFVNNLSEYTKSLILITDQNSKANRLYSVIKLVADITAGCIPKRYKELFADGDYFFYTTKKYGRIYYNEIPLPPLTEMLFSLVKQFMEEKYYVSEKKPAPYVLSLYDMSDSDIRFDQLETLENFTGIYDCAPATVYEYKDDYCCEVYNEIYSF